MFCTQCLRFVHDWNGLLRQQSLNQDKPAYPPFERLLHNDIAGLRSSSDSSCSICRNAWFSLTTAQQQRINRKTAVYLLIILDQNKPIIKVKLTDPDDVSKSSTFTVAMFLREDDSTDLSNVLTECGSLDRSSSGSEANFILARYWIKQCLEGHAACAHRRGFLPTRVLDVGAEDQDGMNVRLVQTTDLKKSKDVPVYAVLSHCWGLQKFLTTTVENLASHQASIAVSALPPSFQDAVHTTRQLKIRFLWIDSLCIVQNSAQDWAQEAVQMSDIYAKALLTLTSAHSTNAFGGMFVKRDGVRTFAFEIPIEWSNHTSHLMFFPTPRREVVWDMSDLSVYKRAWCFQEMVLSQRNLIFDPDGIRFQCVESVGSERDPIGGITRNPLWMRPMQRAINNQNTGVDIFGPRLGDVPERAQSWHWVVANYTQRALTKYSDKLIAIAGIAAVFEAQATGSYVAGLWSNHLYLDLCWFVQYDNQSFNEGGAASNVPHPRPWRAVQPIAPSWSWASLNVPVVFGQYTRARPMCDIINIQPSGSVDGSGEIDSHGGRITLRADTRTMYVYNDMRTYEEDIMKIGKKCRYTDSSGTSRALAFTHQESMIFSTAPPSFLSNRQLVQVRWAPDEMIDLNTPLLFIAMNYEPIRSGMSLETGKPEVTTIALVPTDISKNEYRRVGKATWPDCTWFGYECAKDADFKVDAYKRLSQMWNRINPPKLCASPKHMHWSAEDKFWPAESYHPSVNMKRQSVTLV